MTANRRSALKLLGGVGLDLVLYPTAFAGLTKFALHRFGAESPALIAAAGLVGFVISVFQLLKRMGRGP
jgi:hypothetical protein